MMENDAPISRASRLSGLNAASLLRLGIAPAPKATLELPGYELLEVGQLSALLIVVAQPGQRPLQDRQRPLPVIKSIRSRSDPDLREIQLLASERVERHHARRAALLRVGLCSDIALIAAKNGKQKRAQPPFRGVRFFKEPLAQHIAEKSLHHILRILRRSSRAPRPAIEREPIRRAKLRQRRLCLIATSLHALDETPACLQERRMRLFVHAGDWRAAQEI